MMQRRRGAFTADLPRGEGGQRLPGVSSSGERARKTQHQELTNRGRPTVVAASLATSALSPMVAPRPGARCNAVPHAFADKLAKDVNELTRSIETEVVLESGLHVPAVAAGSCYEKFGLPSETAPPLVVDSPAAMGLPSGLESDQSLDLAICLATPSDDEGGNDVKETIIRALDDLEIKGEIRAEIQNIIASVEELELGSQRQPLNLSQIARSVWRRRSSASSDTVDGGADAAEAEERGVEGSIVEVCANHFRSRPAEAD